MRVVADIGGTNMRVAPVAGDTLGAVHKTATPQDPLEGISALVRAVRDCTNGARVSAFAGCVAGSVDERGVISDARNLRAWEGVNIVEDLSATLNAPVRMLNDAALAGIGEATFGAGRGFARLAYVTVSTGVGGALIINGAVADFGGVGGIKVDGADLEDLVSGTAVGRKFGIRPMDLVSIEERHKLADLLARGLEQLSGRWSPEALVLGGSMIVGVNPIPIGRVQETLDRLLAGSARRPLLKMAELGDYSGLWGGIALLRRSGS